MRSYLQRNLERKIQELNRRDFDGDLKVSFYDISEGKSASVNGSSTGWAASIIKLPVMITVADKIANGELDLETKLLVDHSMVLEETDIVSKLPINSALSVKALLYAMIVRSDNEATNILGKHVGVEEINRQMQSIGMSRSMLGHLLYRGAPRSSNDFNPDGSNITCTDDMVKHDEAVIFIAFADWIKCSCRIF